jgi:hypothetical protein
METPQNCYEPVAIAKSEENEDFFLTDKKVKPISDLRNIFLPSYFLAERVF